MTTNPATSAFHQTKTLTCRCNRRPCARSAALLRDIFSGRRIDLGTCRYSTSCSPGMRGSGFMRTIATMALTAALAFSSNLAVAQIGGAAGGSTVGSSAGSPSIGGTFGVYSPGATTPGSPNIGAGNPGIGDRSDPSIRSSPGLDANGPCNGARSTSGNNTPSC